MKKNFNVFIRIAFILVLVYFTGNIIRIIYDVNQIEKEKEEISEEFDYVEEKVSKLKHRYEMDVDDEYLKRIAKENGYYFPDETVFYNNYNNGAK